MADSLGYSIFLDPADAVRAFELRAPLQPTVRWSEMMHEQHAEAFTVAKVAKLDLLRTFQTSLDGVTRNGGTFEEWKSGIVPELHKAGWWGTVRNRELTGSSETIIVNERRLRTIYDTNVRMSLASGHWQRIQRQKDVLPYLRYLPSTSEHRRPLHMTWYGITLPVDHPFWQTHFPPNGWGCKCHFEQVSERRMRKMGWTVTPEADLPQGAQRFMPATGAPIMVPDGIDPGFSYNPGTAHLRAVADKAARSIEQALSAGLEDAAHQTLREIVDDVAFEQFLGNANLPFPVAIISDAHRSMIGGDVRVTKFSRDTLAKQDIRHDDVTNEQYRLLPRIIETGIVEQQDDKRLRYFWRDAEGKWWRAVVKRTDDGRDLYLVSFHPLNRKGGQRLDRIHGYESDAR